MELTLAMLWASRTTALTPVTLTDVRGNPTLNQVIYNIKEKLKVVGDEDENDGREGRNGEATAWAMSSQTSIVRELNRMQHESRKAEKSLKESNLSLLKKTLGPDGRELFTTLSTTNMELEPTMSEIHGDPSQ
jgi:hypothetical protein